MKKDLSIWMATFAIIFTLSIVITPQKTAHAEIEDGTYEINYEMKESGNDNTSIADGYFTKPATLTVTDGEQYLQLTVTSSSMIKSLDAPSGPVEIVSEDEENETRTVRFRVDGDLSEPVPLEMHVVVPDLYDMEHTARAVFDVSGLEAGSESDLEEDSGENNTIESEDQVGNTNNYDIDEEQASEEETNSESSDEQENSVGNLEKNKDDSEDNSTPNVMWIMSVVVGVIVITGIVFWLVRKKQIK